MTRRRKIAASQPPLAHHHTVIIMLVLLLAGPAHHQVAAYPSAFDKTEKLFDKINLEQSIAAVFNKVAYGSTTKRSIPENAYPLTTLATPLLTTYRYSDGRDEWLRVDVKKAEEARTSLADYDDYRSANGGGGGGGGASYGTDLEKDHELPTSAPAADILKNNNNRNYNNPNRYNNDRLRPDVNTRLQPQPPPPQPITDEPPKATTTYNLRANARPTKSLYGNKDVPNYVPPSRAFFTPPLPPQYLNPFADKPTLRGTNSDSFMNRRPIPPPSLMPNKDRVPFRPDLPNTKQQQQFGGDAQAQPAVPQSKGHAHHNASTAVDAHENNSNKKKTLNTPSQNVNLDRLGEFYGLNRSQNETSFEYEKGYIPSITRILSGSNGRHEEISDILLRTVTATPHLKNESNKGGANGHNLDLQGNRRGNGEQQQREATLDERPVEGVDGEEPADKSEGVTSRKETIARENDDDDDDDINGERSIVTTPTMDLLNLPNVKEESNVTKVNNDEVWVVCWNVHVYLVVTLYILLAAFSIVKLVCYEREPHMFTKRYFLTVHLLLTLVCMLRIFYLIYDPYNLHESFGILAYETLHSVPLSLLATTFAVLVLFLLKRTLNHLKVKTKPVFLVVFGAAHLLLCLALGVIEACGYLERASLIVTRPVFVLVAWALGGSYLYLYRIINKVLAKKAQNLTENCTQHISYASHITIAIALLFILLGFVQLYALFLIPVDRFVPGKHHWILWGYELSVRVLEISIAALLAVVVSLRMSAHREKQSVGLTLFPCTTSDSSADNIFPNNCTTNPNALTYSRGEFDGVTPEGADQRPKTTCENAYDKKQTLIEPQANAFDRFERPQWGSDRMRQMSLDTFERGALGQNSLRVERASAHAGKAPIRPYDTAKYYVKPRFDVEGGEGEEVANVYSEPIDNQYERTRHEFERADGERRSKNAATGARRMRRSAQPRAHLGAQTLPTAHHVDTMLVDDQGFVRFRHLQEEREKAPKRLRKHGGVTEEGRFSDA